MSFIGSALGGLALAAGCAGEPGELDDLVEPVQPAQADDVIYAPLDQRVAPGEGAPLYGDQAYAFAQGMEGARNLAVSGNRVYWIADSGDHPLLYQADLFGDSKAIHVNLEASPIDAVAIDGVPIFEAEGALFRLTADAFSPEKLTSFAAAPVDLAVRDRDLFVATADGCVQWLFEGADDFETLACGGGEPLSLALDADGVWWGSTDGFIYRAEDGEAVPVSKPGFASELAVDHEHVFWAEDNRILSAPRAGMGKISEVTQTQGTIISLIDDRFFLYYSTKEDGSVWQLQKTTGVTRRLAYGWHYPMDLVRGMGDRLFWVDPVEGAVVTQRL